MAYAPWESSLAMFWEYPLGTVDTEGFLWLGDSPDSMSLGAEPTYRKVYGDRYYRKEHLKVNKSSPGGEIGATSFWWSSDGTQIKMNRILNSHFQNTTEVCPIHEPCFVAHYPIGTTEDELGGFTIARDIGDGYASSYVWSSAVCNKLTVSWAVGKTLSIKPEFVCLDGQPKSDPGGIISTDVSYQRELVHAPDMSFYWNGTEFHPTGFRVESKNNINLKHAPTSKSPVGMTLGDFDAVLSIDMWVDSTYSSKFVPGYLGSIGSPGTDYMGTFQCIFVGPIHGEGEQFYGTIQFYGKIVQMPDTQIKESGIQNIKVQLCATDGTAGDYTDAGYFIKYSSFYTDWRTV